MIKRVISIVSMVFWGFLLMLANGFTANCAEAASTSPIEVRATSSVEIRVTSASVKIESTEQSEIYYQYNSEMYSVASDKDDMGNIIIDISGKNVSTDSAVVVYIPNIYENVKVNVDEGFFECDSFNGKLSGTFKDCYVGFAIKKEFSGVIDIQIQDGCYVGFNSANAYRNCKTTIINSSEKYEVSVPTYFKKSGDKYTYVNGTRVGDINVNFVSGSGMGIFN
jgi:hypothetical protein